MDLFWQLFTNCLLLQPNILLVFLGLWHRWELERRCPEMDPARGDLPKGCCGLLLISLQHEGCLSLGSQAWPGGTSVLWAPSGGSKRRHIKHQMLETNDGLICHSHPPAFWWVWQKPTGVAFPCHSHRMGIMHKFSSSTSPVLWISLYGIAPGAAGRAQTDHYVNHCSQLCRVGGTQFIHPHQDLELR